MSRIQNHRLSILHAAILCISGFGYVSFFSGCSTPSAPDPLIFKEEYAGNVSAFYGTHGPARDSANDPAAPDFYWRSSSGALDSLSGQAGKIVLLNFWATWCGPCKAEIPGLQAIAKKYSPDSVIVIGVSVDNNGYAFGKVSSYCQQNGDTYQMVIDSDYHIYQLWAVDGYGQNFDIPYTFLLRPSGTIAKYFVGEQPEATFVDAIDKLR
ncbi:MAG: TlpA disulfide reductase family protein [Bacteroidota bacterium]|nr:TlpA disulfide reductase family protein [Bacteroidota bacterium]MDP4232512.1 TlpA disulfide reductase family protein [Bacteroidota bacterium]MDP4241647.1 TlpA disulfide reductase family protein [Bacteroidota bacterium]MDP4286392.1 TlpA disulfide reductase family protein [Bacteroidota bacterium]